MSSIFEVRRIIFDVWRTSNEGQELGAGSKPSYNPFMTDAESTQQPELPSEKAWEELTKNLLRAEMMKRGVSFATLPEKLAAIGVTDTESNLRNKVGRGRFTAVFFMQCMFALGAKWIEVPDSVEEAGQSGGAQKLAKKKSPPE